MRRALALAILVVAIAACGETKVVRVESPSTTPTTSAGFSEDYGPADLAYCNLWGEFLDAEPDSQAEQDAYDVMYEAEQGELGPTLRNVVDLMNEAEDDATYETYADQAYAFCFESTTTTTTATLPPPPPPCTAGLRPVSPAHVGLRLLGWVG